MSKEILDMTIGPGKNNKSPRNRSVLKGLEPVVLQSIARRKQNDLFIETFEKYVGNRFPEKPNAVLGKNGVHFCRFAPNEIWIIGSLNESNRMINQCRASLENCCSLFDQSQGYTVVELSGPLDLDRLAYGVALDLSAPGFSAPSAALIAIDNIPGFILKTDEYPTFWLAVSKSYFSFFELWWQKIAVQ